MEVPDFDPASYRFLNPDLKNMDEQELLAHFKVHGYKEGRFYRIPEELNIREYLTYNKDLSHMSDYEGIIHYLQHGKKEGRISSTKGLRFNFKPDAYRLMYPDLNNLDDIECVIHIIKFPRKYDDRWYDGYTSYLSDNLLELNIIRQNLLDGLPYNFSPSVYLSSFGADEKIVPHIHYNQNSVTECRPFRAMSALKEGSSVFFVAHNSELTGAPIYVANLINYYATNNIFTNMVLLIPFPYNDDGYKNILGNYNVSILHYYNDIHIFYHLVIKYDPIFIYFNSIFTHFDKVHINQLALKSIFHFHEDIFKLSMTYRNNILSLIKDRRVYTINEKMRQTMFSHGIKSDINANFLSTHTLQVLKNIYIKKPRRKLSGKLLIGMVGIICDRKGFDIFVKSAKELPEYNFMWIGGEECDIQSYCSELPGNMTHITAVPQHEVFKHVSNFDWFFMTSRMDYNPYVALEAMYLGVPLIYLDGNIWQTYPKSTYIRTIKDHYNDYKKIVPQLKLILQTPVTGQQMHDLHVYVATNFNKPAGPVGTGTLRVVNPVYQYAIFSLWNIQTDDQIAYYKNTIQYLRQVNRYQIKIIVVAKVPISEYKKTQKFIYNSKHGFYNYDTAQTHNSQYYNTYNKLCADILILTPTRGYDINGLILGLKYIKLYLPPPKYLLYLHSKTNYLWRRDLHSIIHVNLTDHPYHDTVVVEKWLLEYNEKDNNSVTFAAYPELFALGNTTRFNFVAGTMFNTRYEYLKDLNLDELYNNLTHIDKYDTVWIKAMQDFDTFNKYYNIYKDSPYNAAMSPGAREFLIENNIPNYFALAARGHRGIPDLQFEHAVERYLGYLVCHDKQLLMV